MAYSWAEYSALTFTAGEPIAIAAERGEIVLINALLNAGKMTLALNASNSLAVGKVYPPMVMADISQKVLYIDGETRRARLQRDIFTMSKGFNRDEAIALGQNLHLICEGEIKGEGLNLTRPDHLL